MATGQLRVEVRTAREAIPIVGARIEYFVGSSQVAFRVTDASGIAPAVEFDTPERALSLDADYTGTPYSVCSIRITANRYRSVRIGGVLPPIRDVDTVKACGLRPGFSHGFQCSASGELSRLIDGPARYSASGG